MQFADNFFVPLPKSNLSLEALSKCGKSVWPFLKIIDILNFSITCKTSASRIILSADTINSIISSDKRVSHIGNFQVLFDSPMTLGMLRRTMFRLVQEKTISISIGTNGRILLDIGSAFNDRDAVLASATLLAEFQDTSEQSLLLDVDNDASIEKHLEISSCDEFDDFTPRFPMPKDKTHRRGNSLFNSDIEVYANQALQLSMNDVASLALEGFNSEEPSDEVLVPALTANQRRNRNKQMMI